MRARVAGSFAGAVSTLAARTSSCSLDRVQGRVLLNEFDLPIAVRPRLTVAMLASEERGALRFGFRLASGRSQRKCSGAARAGPSSPPTVSWGHPPERFATLHIAGAD